MFCMLPCCPFSSDEESVLIAQSMGKIDIWIYGSESRHSPGRCRRGLFWVLLASPEICAAKGKEAIIPVLLGPYFGDTGWREPSSVPSTVDIRTVVVTTDDCVLRLSNWDGGSMQSRGRTPTVHSLDL